MSSARALLLLAALCACACATLPLPEDAGPCSADMSKPCLRCTCAGGALLCSHRACAPQPALAPGCHILHHPGLCCPHVYCPGGVIINTELDAGSDDYNTSHAVSVNSLAHACHEDGRTYLSGSAMAGGAACAQCFCVRGARRCVGPRCLPPPPRCAARPAPGLCCPAKYDCSHPEPEATPPPDRPSYDCVVEGKAVPEGWRMPSAASCMLCYCVRGAARCGAQECALASPAPACAPVVPPGHCCPLRYDCSHAHSDALSESDDSAVLHNALTTIIEKDRSFRSVESNESTATPAKDERANKVKRKTNDTAPVTSTAAPTTYKATTTEKVGEETITTETNFETSTPSDQVIGSMKIMINGTINCTTSISSSNVPMNSSAEKEEEATVQSKATAAAAAAAALVDGDIITEREPESFTVRVTSALHAAPPSPAAAPPAHPAPAHNASEDYDYDYVEPTLPPSLPNLKIIPFVAADAVVDTEELPKEAEYPALHEGMLQALERDDNYPVYYPAPPAQRRQDAPPPAPRPSTARPPAHKPAGSLFSPPMETEGGFIPKGAGLSSEYFAVMPPRSGPSLHLTTSMHLGTVQDDEISLTTPRPPETSISTTMTELATTTTREDETPVPAPLPTTSRTIADHEVKAQTHSTASDSTTLVTERATLPNTSETSNISSPFNTTTVAPTTLPSSQYNGSLDYEEEEEDEGFSFGSVLKLLLSESYDSPPRTPAPPPPRPNVAPFVPLPPRPMPQRKTVVPQSSGVHRIDHLVLGEATAIRRTVPPTLATPLATSPPTRNSPAPPTRRPEPPTWRPDPTTWMPESPTRRPEPPTSSSPPPVTRRPLLPTSRRPAATTTRRPMQTNLPPAVSPLDTGGPVPGGLKLAGCNIYGRMYRVGRIITELSGACQECRCTDTGVQCRALPC